MWGRNFLSREQDGINLVPGLLTVARLGLGPRISTGHPAQIFEPFSGFLCCSRQDELGKLYIWNGKCVGEVKDAVWCLCVCVCGEGIGWRVRRRRRRRCCCKVSGSPGHSPKRQERILTNKYHKGNFGVIFTNETDSAWGDIKFMLSYKSSREKGSRIH